MTRLLRLFLGLAFLGCAMGWLSGTAPARQGNTAAVKVEKIKYDDLGNLVRSHKGKVILVDFWADFCVPCKREFPQFVALHNKYKNDGLIAISVALDNPTDPKTGAAIEAFLTKQNAGGLTNLHLDEKVEVWQKKLGIDGPPCVYILNREGRIAAKWDDKVDYADIGRTVADLMKK